MVCPARAASCTGWAPYASVLPTPRSFVPDCADLANYYRAGLKPPVWVYRSSIGRGLAVRPGLTPGPYPAALLQAVLVRFGEAFLLGPVEGLGGLLGVRPGAA